MIKRETIDKIYDTAVIDEVVGDVVDLKRRGSNLIGLCPFHNEKTPSFSVSPSKGIYKCFGCGKGGNVVNFVMEHDHLSYPEALRHLANRYNIEVEEKQLSPEDQEELNERESLAVVLAFAQQWFTEQLNENEEGRNIGLSYLKERGFREDTIAEFQLGYCPDSNAAFAHAAIEKGYNKEHLVSSGLIKVRDNGGLYDMYHGRIIFPIHNISGRVLGFGARTLKSDKKIAKYFNSPENAIYHKSKVLYGLFQAKKSIVEQDACCLVEGYTDVIALHQAGVQNAVASSGTSLTEDQIRAIRRYTKNIIFLFDSDPAGIKASLRGIDMVLEAGMNVRVVLFPEGEDPDSFSRKVSSTELKEYIVQNAQDLILFKTSLLMGEAGQDPIKRAALLHEIVDSIALIPDHVLRSLYIKRCSEQMGMEEQALITEMNKVRRKQYRKKLGRENVDEVMPPEQRRMEPAQDNSPIIHQERDLIRLLLNYGQEEVRLERPKSQDPEFEDNAAETTELEEVRMRVGEVIFNDLQADHISFSDPLLHKIYYHYTQAMFGEAEFQLRSLTEHDDPDMRETVIEMLSERHTLSPNWHKKHHIGTTTEQMQIKRAVTEGLFILKQKRVEQMIAELEEELKNAEDEEVIVLLTRKKQLDVIKKALSEPTGRVVLK